MSQRMHLRRMIHDGTPRLGPGSRHCERSEAIQPILDSCGLLLLSTCRRGFAPRNDALAMSRRLGDWYYTWEGSRLRAMPAPVIASEAKQSSPAWTVVDCFVAALLAMTGLRSRLISEKDCSDTQMDIWCGVIWTRLR